MLARRKTSDDDTGADVAYKPDEQVWTDCGGYWLGGPPDCDSLPTPADLVRRDAYLDRCGVVEIAGQPWGVPKVNPDLETPSLPHQRRPLPDGAWTWEVLPQYHEFQRRALAAWETFVRVQADLTRFSEEMPDDDKYELAEMALGVSYHVSRYELFALGALDNLTVGRAVIQVLDADRVMAAIAAAAQAADEARKKKVTDEPASETGITCDTALGATG